jgi:hypothetical protein
METSETRILICPIPPPYNRLTWWKFNDTKFYLLLGYWYCESRAEWRLEFLELGKKDTIIRSEAKFKQQIDDGLMVEYNQP